MPRALPYKPRYVLHDVDPQSALAAARARAQEEFLRRCPARVVKAVRDVVLENKDKAKRGRYRYAQTSDLVPVYGCVATLSCGHERTFPPGFVRPVVGNPEACIACGPAR